jgi:hypothetical protein
MHMGKPRRRRHRQQRDPWTNEPRDPLEMLARLVGRAASPETRGGGGGIPLADSDLTTALGYCPDKLGAALAMSVAGRTGAMLRYILRRAYRRVCQSGGLPIDVHEAANRFRIRIALVDATKALIWPEQRRSMAAASKEAKMRHGAYSALYRHIEGRLEEYLANGRREFCVRMWAAELAGRIESRSVSQPDTSVGAVILRTDAEPWAPVLYRMAASRAALVTAFRSEGQLFENLLLTAAATALEQLDVMPAYPRSSVEFDVGGARLLLVVRAV